MILGIQEPKTEGEIAQIENDPDAHLHQLNDQTPEMFEAPSGETFQKVPYEHLWLTDGALFIGSVSFRFELNKILSDFGGHVGYGIRPSMSGKGYGNLALKLTLARAAKRGMDRLLITCSPENIASKKIIENNGGQFIGKSDNTHGFLYEAHKFLVPTDV